MTSPMRLLTLFLTVLLMGACAKPQGGDSNTDIKQSSTTPVSSSLPIKGMLDLTVYKSASCGCCGLWVEHMNDNNFQTKVFDTENLSSIKTRYGINSQWQSCHTALSEDGYVFEGHIPAKFVQQFLTHPPADALGLAVAGMPLGSPGMEVGDRFTPYSITLLKKDGSAEIYAKIDTFEQQY